MTTIPVFSYNVGSRTILVGVWNGGRDFTEQLPKDLPRCVGGDEIIIVQVNSPTNGAAGRSSTKLTEALAKIQPHLGGVIHWARDDATYQSIVAELTAEWSPSPPPVLSNNWRPTITVIPIGTNKPPTRSIDNLILGGATVKITANPQIADSNWLMKPDRMPPTVMDTSGAQVTIRFVSGKRETAKWVGRMTPEDIRETAPGPDEFPPWSVTTNRMLDGLEHRIADFIKNGIAPDIDLHGLRAHMVWAVSYVTWYQHGGDKRLQEWVGKRDTVFEFTLRSNGGGKPVIRSHFEVVDPGEGPLFRLEIKRQDGDPVGWSSHYTPEIINDLRFDDMRGVKMPADEIVKFEGLVSEIVGHIEQFGFEALDALAKPHSQHEVDELIEMIMWWVFWRSPLQAALRERAVRENTTVELERRSTGQLVLTSLDIPSYAWAMSPAQQSSVQWSAKYSGGYRHSVVFIRKHHKVWGFTVDLTPQHFSDLRSLPGELPPGFVPANSSLEAETVKHLISLVTQSKAAWDRLEVEVRKTLSMMFWWLVVWHNGNAELQRRAGHEPLTMEIKMLDRKKREIKIDVLDQSAYSVAVRQVEPPPKPADDEALVRELGAVFRNSSPGDNPELVRRVRDALQRGALSAATLFDTLAGRGNWRYDRQQKTWLFRIVQNDGQLHWYALNAEHSWELSSPEAAAWWQRLAAGETGRVFYIIEQAMKRAADPGNIELPDYIVERLRNILHFSQWNRRTRERLFGDTSRRLTMWLRASHKMVWSSSFVELIEEAREDQPRELLEQLQTARLPFETEPLWIETAGSRDSDWGALILPRNTYPNSLAETIVWVTDNTGTFAPAGLFVDFRMPITEEKFKWWTITGETPPSERPPFHCAAVLGMEYYNRWRQHDGSVMYELAQHATHAFGGPPYGDALGSLIGKGFDKVVLKYFQDTSIMARTTLFRELLCGCALAVTHVDGEPLIIEERGKTNKFYVHGKFRPSYELKHVKLRRPMGLPRLKKLMRRRAVRSGLLRYHDVHGHWCHRRDSNDDERCSVHPRACNRAQWRSTKRPEGLWGHDDGPVAENDYQKCIYCDRPRWWRKNHSRGNPEHGIVEKTYEITASTTRRRRPPPVEPEPVEPPPPSAPEEVEP